MAKVCTRLKTFASATRRFLLSFSFSTFSKDAHLFNPYRWLEPSHVHKGVSLGPFANLLVLISLVLDNHTIFDISLKVQLSPVGIARVLAGDSRKSNEFTPPSSHSLNYLLYGNFFSVIEMQAFAVELLSNFEFNTTSKIEKIRREAALGMVLTIEGELEKGAQLPLRVSFASKGEDN